jgi:predicted RNA-binding Zn-ribbon protein involved in translation (DUF1610 family)
MRTAADHAQRRAGRGRPETDYPAWLRYSNQSLSEKTNVMSYCLAMLETTRFDCPNCAAEYKLVRAEAGPPPDHQIECRQCGASLQGREGKFILKYFLVGRGRTQAKAARGG